MRKSRASRAAQPGMLMRGRVGASAAAPERSHCHVADAQARAVQGMHRKEGLLVAPKMPVSKRVASTVDHKVVTFHSLHAGTPSSLST